MFGTMSRFHNLSTLNKLAHLKMITTYATYSNLTSITDIPPDFEYNPHSLVANLQALATNPGVYKHFHQDLEEYTLHASLMNILASEPFKGELLLDSVWGFILENNGEYILKCQNKLATTDSVAIININSLYDGLKREKDIIRRKRLTILGFLALFISASFLKNVLQD
jgi:hypothetical protein